ncbi:phosphatidylinositol kinase- protein kinase tor1, partial [Coemansia sp. RSA 1939]
IVDADASGKTGSQNPVYIDINNTLRKYINSGNPADRLACTCIISAFVDIDGLEDMQKTRIVNQLKSLYSSGSDSTVCAEAVTLYGQLVRKKWPVVVSSIKPELDLCMEWLSAERDFVRQITALRLIQVICNGASTTMYLYILNILNCLRTPLRSSLLEMRETTASTLAISLELVLLHEDSARVMLLDNIYQELLYNYGLGSIEGYHAALLLCQAMLVHGGDYMQTHYSDVSKMVLELKDHKSPVVRNVAIGLLPILAHFSPSEFASIEINGKQLMSTVCGYLIETAEKLQVDSRVAFLALGNIAQCCSSDFQPFLEPIARIIKNGLFVYANATSKQKPECKQTSSAILQTISILASAMGAELTPHMYEIIDLMFVGGLSEELCDSLNALLDSVSQLRPAIHDRLLNVISLILVNAPFRQDEPAIDEIEQRLGFASLHHTVPVIRNSSKNRKNAILKNSKVTSVKKAAKDISVTQEAIVFALQTLARFDFSQENLSEFVRNAVMQYVGNSSAAVRKAAIQTVVTLLLTNPMYAETEGPGAEVGSEAIQRIVTVAATDIDSGVRLVAIQALKQESQLDFYLSNEQNIKSLLLLVNDEMFEMRLSVINVIGRLAAMNPGNAVSSIHRLSSQLLMELEFANTTNEHEECIQLLMELTQVAERWMKPCINDIFIAILPRINNSPPRLSSKFLDMVTTIAQVSGGVLKPHSNHLMSTIVGVLNTHTGGPVCLSALRALSSCASYCGMAIDSYLEYPRLFSTLTAILRGHPDDEIRSGVVQTIGALGAVDPHRYKRITDAYPGAQRSTNGDINGTGIHSHTTTLTHTHTYAHPITHVNADTGEVAGGGGGGDSGGNGSINTAAGAKAHMSSSIASGAKSNARHSKKRENKIRRAKRKNPRARQGPPPNIMTLLFNDDDSSETHAGGIPADTYGRQFTCDYYYTDIAIQVLIGILDNTLDTSSDQYAVQALLHLCAPLKAGCSPYLNLIIPAILRAMRASPLQAPTFFIQQLAKLVNTVSEFIRPNMDLFVDLFDIESLAGDQHRLSLVSLAEAMGKALYGELGPHTKNILQFLIVAMDEDTSDSLNVTQSILEVLKILSPNLDNYLQLVMPRLVHRLDPKNTPVPVISTCLNCISLIVSVVDCSTFASRIVLTLIRLLQHKQAQSLHGSVMDTLCTLMEQLQDDFAVFMPTIDAIIKRSGIPAHKKYKEYSRLLFSRQLIPAVPTVHARQEPSTYLPESVDGISNLQVNVPILQLAWSARSQMTEEDCSSWLNNLFLELLQQSPSSSLRACYNLAIKNPQLISQLFNVAFVSCWTCMTSQYQMDLVKSLEMVASNQSVPLELLQTILDLADFMERDKRQLPIDIKVISSYAARSNALAKEIRHKEAEWMLEQSDEAIDRLIELNQSLGLDDEAVGLLNYVSKDKPDTKNNVEWCMRLKRWDEALAIYQRQELHSGPSNSNLLGQIRCLFEMSDWNALMPIYDRIWRGHDHELQSQSAEIGVKLAWSVGDIERMEFYLSSLKDANTDTSLDRALLCIHQNRIDEAMVLISECRKELGHTLDTHLTELYRQGYSQIFDCQVLAELEEVIAYKMSPHDNERRAALVSTWKQRLEGIQQDVGMWQKLLGIHNIVLRPVMDLEKWTDYANICRSSGKLTMARNAICQILDDEASYMEEILRDSSTDGQSVGKKSRAREYMSLKERIVVNQSDISLNTAIRLSQQPMLVYSYLKYKWAANERREAFQLLEMFIREYSSKVGFDPRNIENFTDHTNVQKFAAAGNDKAVYYLARFYFKHAEWLSIVQQSSSLAQATQGGGNLGADGSDGFHAWRTNISELPVTPNSASTSNHVGMGNEAVGPAQAARLNKTDRLTEETNYLFRIRGERINEVILDSYRATTVLDNKWYRAWHSLALRHYHETQRTDSNDTAVSEDTIETHIVPAVYGFLRSIQLSKGGTSLQDALRLLTAWFNYSKHESVVRVIQDGLDSVPINTWLQVIPQILACIHIKHEGTNKLIRQVLVKIGRAHPQSILFSLYVTARSDHQERNRAAKDVLAKLHSAYPELVEEAEVVSRELIQAASLMPEMWYYAISKANDEYLQYKDMPHAVSLLKPMHDRMKNLKTANERKFAQSMGADITMAEQYVKRYFAPAAHNRNIELLHRAWGVYARLQDSLWNMINQFRKLYTRDIAPTLLQCRNMNLAVPGSYHPEIEVVRIDSFCAEMTVYQSKQKPRMMHIYGSNGMKYKYLLKGNEDLRQDERAMQLFGLINSLLLFDKATSQRSLAIEQFPVVPLSSDAGLIGFYPNCENMGTVIERYRVAHKKNVRIEQEMALQFAPNYGRLTGAQKAEAFEYVFSNTRGDDLQWAMWYRSPSAEVWVQQRTSYTRSMAVMSMAGYILGLGDRHLSNIMLHGKSGKIVHIDFGDCFEVAIHRSRYPETIPFRLTRMVVLPMGVNKTEGSFRLTANHAMRVLRANRDSLMAVLEAFVFDPLSLWSFSQNFREEDGGEAGEEKPTDQQKQKQKQQQQQKAEENANENDGLQPSDLKARAVIMRIQDKLAGRDFNPSVLLSVEEQVSKLIQQAMLPENLAPLYPPWQPFW